VDAAKVCRGCGRTLDEIAAWSGADEARRVAIRAAASARLAAGNAGSGVRQPGKAAAAR